MASFPVIDTDGHVLERQSDIRKYLAEPFVKRPTGLWPGDQPWDNDMMDSFELAREWTGLSAAEQVYLAKLQTAIERDQRKDTLQKYQGAVCVLEQKQQNLSC
ncbi:MAG TPA: hypothetical protein VH851_19265 [Candidatus Binatia bacterium]